MFQSTRPRGTRPESHYGRGGTGGFNPRVRAGRDPATRSIGTRVTFQSTRPRGTRLNLRVNHIRRQCVSIHASARDATYLGGVPSGSYRFQSTRPRGTRHIVLIVFPPCHWFQSTRPRGTRPAAAIFSDATSWFQSTRPRGTRLVGRQALRLPSGFNPRVRAGRDAVNLMHSPRLVVSIHASARDATRCRDKSLPDELFQSTRPRGTRPRCRVCPDDSAVSIHASARDATARCSALRCCRSCFNPRVRAGRDEIRLAACGHVTGFNPRVRAGRDASPGCGGGLLPVSIHASARDATIITLGRLRIGLVSIHASARDATPPSPKPKSGSLFQSTRPRGTRRTGSAVPCLMPVSIHASARDATCARSNRRPPRSCFNPRVRAGRDHCTSNITGQTLMFQSTRPRGTRLRRPHAHIVRFCFNPRVRAGRDKGSSY